MNACIVTIGDELLIGQIVNSNAAWMASALTDLGVVVDAMVTIGDREDEIRRSLDTQIPGHGLVLITGGLGPTHDDITKSVLADYFGRSLEFHEDIFEEIRRRFEARGIPLAASNRGQAMVPEGFDVLHNPIGTAPGLWHDHPLEGGYSSIVVLPGVPQEMKRIMTDSVLPRVEKRAGAHRIVRRTILTTGIGESNLNELLGDLTPFLDERLRLAFLPGLQGVRLRITAYPDGHADVGARMDELEQIIRKAAGQFVVGTGDDSMELIAGRMLRSAGLCVAVAESCTGGLLLSRLTDIPGASDYVLGGVVAYDNAVKEKVLGVTAETLESAGAVSRRVVTEMAEGVRLLLNADVGLSTSGILGPGGGTDEKPVGTVWIGLADANGSTASLLRLGRDRGMNKERTVTAALNLLRVRLLKSERI